MSREHPGPLRLFRTPFTEKWFSVRLAQDNVTIIDRWPLHDEDAEHLDVAIRARADLDELTGAIVRVRALAAEYGPCEYYPAPRSCITVAPEMLNEHGCPGCRLRAALDDPSPATTPPAPAPSGCACACHREPGMMHVQPCCDRSGEQIL